MKQKFILLLLLLGVATTEHVFSQDYFLWTNNGADENWTNPDNWDFWSGDSLSDSPASFYPGRNTAANPLRNENDVALFDSTSSGNCYLGLPGTALRGANLIVDGYTGTIFQSDDHWFLLREADSGPWDDILIASDEPVLTGFVGMHAYKVFLNFGPGGGFQGGNSTGVYEKGLSIAIPFHLKSGTFRLPENNSLFQHDITVDSDGFFDASLHGKVIFQNRSGESGYRYYDMDSVRLWDHERVIKGLNPRSMNTGTSNMVIENDFIQAGYGSFIWDGTGLFEVKGDVYMEAGPSIWYASYLGNLLITLNGEGDQHTHHTSTDPFKSVLPNLQINKTSGDVIMHGALTIQDTIIFTNGNLVPFTPSVSQDSLTLDRLVLASGSSAVGASDSSFCEGPVQYTNLAPYEEFPTGKSDIYAPVGLFKHSALNPNSGVVEYFNTIAEVGIVDKDDPVENIANCEVWAHNYLSGSPLLYKVQLPYSAETCIDTGSCHIAVGFWGVDEWQSLSSAGITLFNDSTTTAQKSDGFVNSNEVLAGHNQFFTIISEEIDVCDSCTVDASASYAWEAGTFSFTNTTSLSDSLFSILWNFDDEGISDLENPTFTFEDVGLQTITLTVVAKSGTTLCTDTYTFYVYNNPTFGMAITKTPGHATAQEAIAQAGTAGLDTNTEMFLEIYPNPSNIGQITLSGNIENAQYMITTLSGELVLQGNLNNNRETVDVSNMSSGLYIVNINNGVTTVTKKLIIQ